MAGKFTLKLGQGYLYYQLLVGILEYLLCNQHTSHLFNLHIVQEAIRIPGFLLQPA